MWITSTGPTKPRAVSHGLFQNRRSSKAVSDAVLGIYIFYMHDFCFEPIGISPVDVPRKKPAMRHCAKNATFRKQNFNVSGLLWSFAFVIISQGPQCNGYIAYRVLLIYKWYGEGPRGRLSVDHREGVDLRSAPPSKHRSIFGCFLIDFWIFWGSFGNDQGIFWVGPRHVFR